ncbi:DUF2867 domain-containing protein [Hymenobacter sp. BT683]|uniref:DUF2867 domain-containing protein n=1 Tax=Hymenobacter jeongseonensis TaxID=2791027 RepID=A0ABS0IFS1_9BACT|nr:DUF2867 domain-containing protein [Hymenobacter jeongseonensis]MBF9237208.1 DUF2867 domain-containing protein [Hymenobacter jeongseonensis]
MPPPVLPPASIVRNSLPRVDFLDTFCLDFHLGRLLTASEAAQACFQQAPAWVLWLMRLRNALVKMLGLATTLPPGLRALQRPLVPGDFVGPFRTFAASPSEVLLGLNDRHLDFRVSVLVAREPHATRVFMSTAVQYHNLAGRLYFAVVRPFHAAIVPAMLRACRARLLAR